MERLNAASHLDRHPALHEAPYPTNGRDIPSPPVYNTGLGQLTFEELYKQTSRTVGYVMREKHGMTNPEDIDDCMQAGYLKVWQQLQKHPDCFADKPKRYIVQAIIFRSKAQRFSHQRHYHKIFYDADVDKQRSIDFMSTNQVDTWIDLERAIGCVAHQVEDQPAALLGLYCQLTQATMQDVASTFGIGYSTLNAHKRRVKADLAAALVGYGPQPANGPTEMVSPIPPEPATGLVTTRLFEAVNDTTERVIYSSRVKPPAKPRSTARESIPKSEIPHPRPETYPTHWGGVMTLEQIITDPVVRRSAYAKAGRLSLNADDQEDCVQQGFIHLWQKLCDDPKLLADKGPMWVGIYVAYSGNPKQFQRQYKRQQRFTHPDFDWQDADEYLHLGLLSDNRPTRARWTAEVDETLDVNRFLDTMNRHYANHPRKQIALQAVIGTLSSQQAARQLGVNEKNFAATIGNQVRQEVQALLPDTFKDAQPKSWETQLAQGLGVEFISEIASEIQHDQRLLLALYVVTTSASKQAVAESFGYGLTAFGNDIRKIKQMIANRYRRDLLRQDWRQGIHCQVLRHIVETGEYPAPTNRSRPDAPLYSP